MLRNDRNKRKRKFIRYDEYFPEDSDDYTKRRRHNYKKAPPVNNLDDLIKLGKSDNYYKNINMNMLWRITPYLEELVDMVGMDDLKQSIFYQIIYYLQDMHLRNREGEYLHTVIYGPPGCGKCLGINTPVMMYNGGTKMVQDIVPGDILMGDDSKKRNVLSTCHGNEKLYKISQSYGDDYVVNESHILSLMLVKTPLIIDSTKKSKYIVKWVDKKGTYTKDFPYDDKVPVYNDIVNDFVPQLPGKGDKIDIELRDYLNRDTHWKSCFYGYKVPVNFPHYIKDNITSSDPYMVGFNLNNSDSILDVYKYGTREDRLTVLAGLIDSCGRVERDSLYVIKLTKTPELIRDITTIFTSVGLRVLTGVSTYKFQEFYITGPVHNIPTRYVKVKNYQEIDVLLLSYKITITPMDVGDYYGFQLDGNNRFLLGDYTVTHNTTVSKIIGKLYKLMGVLSEHGPFRIAYRDDFIAEYLGQTAVKTRKLLKSCLGGVLFIDEAYALGPQNSDKDSFSKEALDTLTSFLSENKSNFCCIIAGYEKDIKQSFFAMNHGLERRFQWVHKIDKYKPMELTDIFLKMVKDINWKVSATKEQISDIFEKSKEFLTFAGGDMENLLSKAKMNHARRVFNMDNKHKFNLSFEDLEQGIKMLKQTKQGQDSKSKPPFGMYI